MAMAIRRNSAALAVTAAPNSGPHPHRKASRVRRVAAGALIAGVGVSVPLLAAGAANADTSSSSGTPAPGSSSGTYTVVPGDTLPGIAAKLGLDWQALYQENTSVIGSNPNPNPNPNLILPGQALGY
jgi:LysM repeat protein